MKKEILKRMVALSVALAVVPCGMASAEKAVVQEGTEDSTKWTAIVVNGRFDPADNESAQVGSGGYGSIAIGNGAKANVGTGDNAIAIGSSSDAAGQFGVAVGSSAKATEYGTTSIGTHSGATGRGASALGGWATASEESSTALGYYAEASGKYSLAEGHKAKASGKNATAIGTSAKASAGDAIAIGSGAEASGAYSLAEGYGAEASKEGATAIGNGAQATHENSVALGAGSVTAEANSVSVGSGGAAGVPATAPAYRKIVNVADGVNDHDAVTVGQLNKALEGVSAGGSVDLTGYAKTADVNAALDTKANASDVYTKTEVDTKLDTKANAATTLAGYGIVDAYTKTEVDTKLDTKANAADVYTKTEADSLLDAKADAATTLAGYGITDAYTKIDIDSMIGSSTQDISALESRADAMQQDLSDLNAEVVKTNDHFNAELQKTNDHFNTELGKTNQQVVANAQGIAANSSAITGLDQRVTSLDGRVDKVGAGAAALAALHPLDYDSENKLSFAAGVGNYAGSTAAAVGAFYRPNEDVMFSIGGTAGNGENMVNLGASFAIGKGSSGVARLSKVELVNKVQQMETKCEAVDAENKELRHEINNAKAENQKLQDRIAKLEAMVMKLAAK